MKLQVIIQAPDGEVKTYETHKVDFYEDYCVFASGESEVRVPPSDLVTIQVL